MLEDIKKLVDSFDLLNKYFSITKKPPLVHFQE